MQAEAVEIELEEKRRKWQSALREHPAFSADAGRTERIASVHNCDKAADAYFSACLKAFANPRIAVGKDASHAANVLKELADHHEWLKKVCIQVKLDFEQFKPSPLKFQKLQSAIRHHEPEVARDLRDRFIRLGLPTYGFDSVSEPAKIHWTWFSIGSVLLLAALFFAWRAFGQKDLTGDQRQILLWILPLASGFATSAFAGSIFVRARKLIPGLLICATGGFAVWLLTFVFLFKSEARTGRGSHPPPLATTNSPTLSSTSTNQVALSNENPSIAFKFVVASRSQTTRSKALLVRSTSSGGAIVSGQILGEANVAGKQLGMSNAESMFVLQTSAEGQCSWGTYLPAPKGSITSRSLAFANDQSILLTGDFDQQLMFADMLFSADPSGSCFITRISTNGSLLWIKSFRKVTDPILRVDQNNEIWVAFNPRGTNVVADFGGGELHLNDSFGMCRLTSEGTLLRSVIEDRGKRMVGFDFLSGGDLVVITQPGDLKSSTVEVTRYSQTGLALWRNELSGVVYSFDVSSNRVHILLEKNKRFTVLSFTDTGTALSPSVELDRFAGQLLHAVMVSDTTGNRFAALCSEVQYFAFGSAMSVLKVNESGELLWRYEVPDRTGRIEALAADPRGGVWMVGAFAPGTAFIAKLTTRSG